jgi:hypothetical protein
MKTGLRITLKVSNSLTTHELLQKLTDLIVDLEGIGDVHSIQLFFQEDPLIQKPWRTEDYEDDVTDRNYEDK